MCPYCGEMAQGGQKTKVNSEYITPRAAADVAPPDRPGAWHTGMMMRLLSVVQRSEPRQHDAFQHFEAGPAAGADMSDFIV